MLPAVQMDSDALAAASSPVSYAAHERLMDTIQSRATTNPELLALVEGGTVSNAVKPIADALAAAATKPISKIFFWILVVLSIGFYYLWARGRVDRLAADGTNVLGRAFLTLNNLCVPQPPPPPAPAPKVGDIPAPPMPPAAENQLEELCQFLFEADEEHDLYTLLKEGNCSTPTDLECLFIPDGAADSSAILEKFSEQFLSARPKFKLRVDLSEKQNRLQWNVFIAKAAQCVEMSLMQSTIDVINSFIGYALYDSNVFNNLTESSDFCSSLAAYVAGEFPKLFREETAKEPLCHFVYSGAVNEENLKNFIAFTTNFLRKKIDSSITNRYLAVTQSHYYEKSVLELSSLGTDECGLYAMLGLTARNQGQNRSTNDPTMEPCLSQLQSLLDGLLNKAMKYVFNEESKFTFTLPPDPSSSPETVQMNFVEFLREAGKIVAQGTEVESGYSVQKFLEDAQPRLSAAQKKFAAPLDGNVVDSPFLALLCTALGEAEKFRDRSDAIDVSAQQ
jgi:hypothetical protein